MQYVCSNQYWLNIQFSFFGILIFGESPRKLLILVMPFYIIGTIFIGAIAKIILKIKQSFLLNKDLQ